MGKRIKGEKRRDKRQVLGKREGDLRLGRENPEKLRKGTRGKGKEKERKQGFKSKITPFLTKWKEILHCKEPTHSKTPLRAKLAAH